MTILHDIRTQIDELKARLASARPLPEAALHKIEEALAIEYTYESNRIEGNTLTLQETALVIEEGLTIGGKSLREHLEAINHNEAIAFIKDIAQGEEPITERTILQIHALILRGIDRQNAGRYRTVPARPHIRQPPCAATTLPDRKADGGLPASLPRDGE